MWLWGFFENALPTKLKTKNARKNRFIPPKSLIQFSKFQGAFGRSSRKEPRKKMAREVSTTLRLLLVFAGTVVLQLAFLETLKIGFPYPSQIHAHIAQIFYIFEKSEKSHVELRFHFEPDFRDSVWFLARYAYILGKNWLFCLEKFGKSRRFFLLFDYELHLSTF